MTLRGPARMVRIHFGEDDRWQGKPLHEAIVEEARRREFACYCAHADCEGRGHLEAFERLLRSFEEVVPLGSAPLEAPPVGRMVRGCLPGRSGEVSMQEVEGSLPAEART